MFIEDQSFAPPKHSINTHPLVSCHLAVNVTLSGSSRRGRRALLEQKSLGRLVAALYIVEICSFEYPLPPAARSHSFHPSLALRCAAAAYVAYARLTCSLLRPRPPTTFWNRFHWFASGAGSAGDAAAGVVAGSAGVATGSDDVVGALAGVVAGSVGVVIGSNGGGLMGVALSGAYSGTPCRSTEPS